MSDEKVWELAKDFKVGTTVVRVTRLVQHRPRYSFTVIRETEEGKTQRHFGIFLDSANDTCKLRASLANTIARLIADAETWAEREGQRREAEILGGQR